MTTETDTEKLAQPSSGTVPVAWPPPHDRYLVERNGHACVATPCYGMHSPWWVVETLTGQLDPRPIESGDQWHAIAAHESRAQPASAADGWVMVPRKISEVQADILGIPVAWYERAVSIASGFGRTFAAPQPPAKGNG